MIFGPQTANAFVMAGIDFASWIEFRCLVPLHGLKYSLEKERGKHSTSKRFRAAPRKHSTTKVLISCPSQRHLTAPRPRVEETPTRPAGHTVFEQTSFRSLRCFFAARGLLCRRTGNHPRRSAYRVIKSLHRTYSASDVLSSRSFSSQYIVAKVSATFVLSSLQKAIFESKFLRGKTSFRLKLSSTMST